MLKWAVVFLAISLIAGVLGFTNLSAGAAIIAKTLFILFFVVFLLLVVLAIVAGQMMV